MSNLINHTNRKRKREREVERERHVTDAIRFLFGPLLSRMNEYDDTYHLCQFQKNSEPYGL